MTLFTYKIFPYYYNMALDEWLMGKGTFLRLYGWEKPTLSYGRNQKTRSLNIDYCKSQGFSYVRRPSGGRAVFHEFELTYSFVTFKKNLPESIYESYKVISKPILQSLKKIGLNAEFHRLKMSKTHHTSSCFDAPNLYEIAVDEKKIVGSAQWRNKDSVLQHGSILFDWNKDHWSQAHSASKPSLVSKTLGRSMTTVKENGIDVEVKDFCKILADEFNKYFKINFINPEIKEDTDFIKLLNKYKSDEWNLLK